MARHQLRAPPAGDLRPAAAENVEARFGAPKPLNVTVTGRLRVAIVATSLVQTDPSCSAVWAKARLIAARADIEALTVEP